MKPSWTLEYIDQLSQQDVADILAHAEGISRAKKQIS
jgi:hypothetical protein